MSSNLKKALEKLREAPLRDLPNAREDPVWNEDKKALFTESFRQTGMHTVDVSSNKITDKYLRRHGIFVLWVKSWSKNRRNRRST
jgi:hypothetical protein